MRVPRKAGEIIFGNVVAKVIEQEERVEVRGVAEAEGATEMNTGALHSWFGGYKSFYGAYRHSLAPLSRVRRIACALKAGTACRAPTGPAASGVSVDGYGCALYQMRVVATQKQNDARDFFRLRPFCKIGFGHGLAIRGRVDDARRYGIGAYAGAFKVRGKGIDHRDRRRFRRGIGGCSGSMVDGGF